MKGNVIVSGASRGIGFELALNFAEKGYKVLAIARSSEGLLNLSAMNDNIQILQLDLIDSRLKIEISQRYSEKNRIDYIVNNAGQLINKPFIKTNLSEFANQFESNCLTAVSLIQVCYPYLEQKSHIVNITSMGGFQGSSKFSGLSAYSSSKGALSILSECLAEELKEEGIKVNALALGAVETEMLKTAFPEYIAPLSAKKMAKYISDFTINSGEFLNGKVVPVALGNP